MRKTVTAAAMAASLTIGGATGAVLFAPTLSGAQSDDPPADEPAEHDDHDRFLDEALAPLVDDGTITQAQADAVVEAIRDARPPGRWAEHRFPFGSALTDVLGIDADELRDALADGQTIAEIAEANGVPVDGVVDALVAEAGEHLDEAVADGRLDRAEADERLAELTERITAAVQGEAPLGPRHHRLGPGGPFGPGAGFGHGDHDDATTGA